MKKILNIYNGNNTYEGYQRKFKCDKCKTIFLASNDDFIISKCNGKTRFTTCPNCEAECCTIDDNVAGIIGSYQVDESQDMYDMCHCSSKCSQKCGRKNRPVEKYFSIGDFAPVCSSFKYDENVSDSFTYLREKTLNKKDDERKMK